MRRLFGRRSPARHLVFHCCRYGPAIIYRVPDPDEYNDDDRPLAVDVRRSSGDRIFRLTAISGGAATLALMGLIGAFLFIKATPALREAGSRFLTESEWTPATGRFGILAVLVGTVMISFVAVSIAVPVAIGAALFMTELAPRRLRRLLTSLVDLLAAVPSLIYGLWGLYFLQQHQIGLSRWLDDHLGFIPLFDAGQASYASSTLVAGTVVSLMVLPICTAVMREVFSQAPPGEKEGALALGATRWGMIRSVVLPFGRGGIVGGSMLGLGRALGETIAVTLIISPIFIPRLNVVESGGNSIAALIALKFGEADEFGISALMAAGLVLFLITLIVNAFASVVVSRSRSGAAVEI